MKTTVLLPGGFKPPHQGHIELAKKYAANPQVEKVLMLIGPSERDGITRNQSLEALKLLLKNEPKIQVIPVTTENPMVAAFDQLLNLPKNAVGSYALGTSEKGSDAQRFKMFDDSIKTYKTNPTKDGRLVPKGVEINNKLKVDVKPINYKGRSDEKNGQGISASIARDDIRAGDRSNFATNYPGIDRTTTDRLFDIFSKTIKEPEKKASKKVKKEEVHISDILQERAINRLTLLSLLIEGGNAIPDSIPVEKKDIKDVVKKAIAFLPKELQNKVEINIGSSGYKAQSGDIDIFVDEDAVIEFFKSKDAKEAKKQLEKYFSGKGLESKTIGRNVHIGLPYNNAKAQVDFMVIKDASTVAPWHQHGPRGSYEDPEFKGSEIFILLSSISKALGLKFDAFGAKLVRRDNEEVVARDRDKVAKILLNPKATENDLNSVKSILKALENDPKKDEKLAQAREDEKKGLVNLSFKNLKEEVLAEDEGPRIQHPEDLIYWEGSKGAKRAVDTINKVAKDPSSISVKWDGSPAIVFGVDEAGNFILTDKSGFTAKGYDGKAKSSKELEKMFSDRAIKSAEKKGEKPDFTFAKSMASIFDDFKAAFPKGIKGYFKGDLLYKEKPKIENGNFVFKPNITTYKIPVNSDLGKQIQNSKVGVVVHSFSSLDGQEKKVSDFKFNPNSGVLVMPPTAIKNSPKINSSAASSAVSSNASAADSFLNSSNIGDLSNVLYKFTNNYGANLKDLNSKKFLEFVDQDSTINPTKKKKISDHVQSNIKGLESVFNIVKAIAELKNDVVSQLDSQDTGVKSSINGKEGGEGYVISDKNGAIKLVNRAGFTAANRAVQR